MSTKISTSRRPKLYTLAIASVAAMFLSVGSAAAVTIGTGTKPTAPTPTTQPAAGTVSIVLGAGPTVMLNDLVDVSGTLTVCGDGTIPFDDGTGNIFCGDGTVPTPVLTDLSGQTVVLQQANYPYTNFVNVAQTTTDGDGNYDFQVKANFTAHYRVQIASLALTSTEAPLIVNILPTYPYGQNSPWGSGVVKEAMVFQVPAAVKLTGLKVVWYVHNTGKPWTRIGYTRFKSIGNNKFRADIRVKAPAGLNTRGAGTWYSCFEVPKSIPLFNPANNKCPSAKSLPSKAIKITNG